MQNLVLFWLLSDTLSMKKKNIWDDSLFYFYPAISLCFNNDTKKLFVTFSVFFGL